MGGVEHPLGRLGLEASTLEIVACTAGVRPIRSLEATAGHGLSAARWRFDALPAIGGPLPWSMLCYRAAGSASATKTVDGRSIRKRPRVGSVTYAPSDGRATWSVDGAFETVHVYLFPAAIQRVAGHQLDFACAPEIEDFFAIEDPWLAGYFQMLMSELEMCNPLDRSADPLLLDQSEHLLVQHLLRWHPRGTAGRSRAVGAERRTNPLRPALLRRAEDYIRANLAGEISLASLARLSPRSFSCRPRADPGRRLPRTTRGITCW